MTKKDLQAGVFVGHVGCAKCSSLDNLAIYKKEDKDGEYFDGMCQTPDCGFKSREWLVEHDSVTEDALARAKGVTNRGNGGSGMELSDEDIENIQEVLEKPIVGWSQRKIPTDVCKKYGVRTDRDDDGNVEKRYYPSTYQGKLVGFHVRNDVIKQRAKKAKAEGRPAPRGIPFFPIGKCKTECELFGQSIFPKGGKFLVITGGEEDAMAVYTATKTERYETPCVSPTIGEGNAWKQIEKNYEWVNSFQTIVVMFDNDEAGKEGASKISKMFGTKKVIVADLIYNDPCEYLKNGKKKELADAFWRALPKKPSQVLTVDDIFERALQLPEMGLSLPWTSATEATLGLRKGEIHIVGAAPKIGKTEHQHQMIKHMTEVHNERVGVMSLEENPVKTLKKVAGKYAGKQFTKPPEVGGYSLDEMRIAFDGLRDKIEFYSSEGERDADEILSTIRYWATTKDIWFFIIDPLTALVAEYDSSQANDVLNSFMSKAASMCMELNITMFMYSHVNPPKTGKSHDQGGDVLSSQFTGSRAMEKWAHYGWGIQRDRTEKDEKLRNVARVTMLFDREFGEWCEYYAFYNKQTNDWSECPEPIEGDMTDFMEEPDMLDNTPVFDQRPNTEWQINKP